MPFSPYDLPDPLVSEEIKLRYKEPFLTSGLNAKMAAIVPAGIYRGFLLPTGTLPGSSILTLGTATVPADNIAVFQKSGSGLSDPHYSVTLRKTGTAVAVNFVGSPTTGEHVLALVANFAVGPVTTAKFQSWQIDDYLAFLISNPIAARELVIIGTVTLAGGSIVTAVSDKFRTMAWDRIAPEAAPWSPLLRNGGFETGVLGTLFSRAAAYWESASSVGTVGWTIGNAHTNAGSAKSMEISAAGVVTGTILQTLGVVRPPGRRVRISVAVKTIQQALGGTLEIAHEWVRADGSLATGAAITLISSADIAAPYRVFERYLTVPTGGSPVTHLNRVGFKVNGMSWALATAAIAIDDVQVWQESTPQEAAQATLDQQFETVMAHEVQFSDPAVPASTQALKLTYTDNPPTLTGGRRDDLDPFSSGDMGIINWLGQLLLGSNLINTGTRAALPRHRNLVASNATSEFTLLYEAQAVAGGSVAIRFYSDDTGGLHITQNASYLQGTGWTKDAGGSLAIKFSLEADRIRMMKRTGAGVFATAAWETANTFVLDATLANTLGKLILGSGLDSSTLALQPRVLAPAATIGGPPRTLLWETTSSALGVRIFSKLAGNFEIVLNASWNGTVWTKDVVGTAAGKFTFAQNNIEWTQRLAASAGTWTDASGAAGWDSTPATFSLSGLLNSFTGSMALGSGLVSTEANALLARLTAYFSTVAGVERTLITSLGGSDGVLLGIDNTNVYAKADGTVELVYNAFYNGTQWVRSLAGDCHRYVFTKNIGQPFEIQNYPAANASPFNEVAWVPSLTVAPAAIPLTLNRNVLAPQIFHFGNRTNTPGVAGVTVFLSPGYQSGGQVPTNDEPGHEFLVPASGRISNLYVFFGGAGLGGAETLDVRLRKNGVDTALTTVITHPAVSGSDTTNAFNVTAGDRIAVKIFESAGGGVLVGLKASMTFTTY